MKPLALLRLFPRRCGKLLLRPGPPHETAQDPHDAQPSPQLRPVQEHGDLCEFNEFFLCFLLLSLSAHQIRSVIPQRPHKANNDDMTKYHSDDYIRFLKSIRPDNMSEHSKQMQRCECGPPGLTSEASLFVSNIQHLCLSLCSQSTLVKTAPCSTACLSFVSSPLVDLLVGHRSLPQLQIARKGPVCMICLHV